VYFPHQTFVSDVNEIPILFPFTELPFSILFPIKNMKKGNGFSVYRPFPTVFIPTCYVSVIYNDREPTVCLFHTLDFKVFL
jgi:hypothetical protein